MAQTCLMTGSGSFQSARRAVVAELKKLGFWSKKVANVKVRQAYVGVSYGWQYYRGCGDIVLPKLSILRLFNMVCYGEPFPLRDVLRHEYGHAIADCHRGLMRSTKFRDAFGAPHDDDGSFEYDETEHVTYYASDSAAEDFAETFMHFVKRQGRLPDKFNTVAIREKWRFVEHVSGRMKELA